MTNVVEPSVYQCSGSPSLPQATPNAPGEMHGQSYHPASNFPQSTPFPRVPIRSPGLVIRPPLQRKHTVGQIHHRHTSTHCLSISSPSSPPMAGSFIHSFHQYLPSTAMGQILCEVSETWQQKQETRSDPYPYGAYIITGQTTEK